MIIHLVMQPPTVNCCAQACCAMLTQMELESVCEEFGHSHASYTREAISFLRKHGYSCPDRLSPIKKKEPLPDLCIVKLRFEDLSMGHFVVYHDGIVYDPANGKTLLHRYGSCVRATSFLPLKREE